MVYLSFLAASIGGLSLVDVCTYVHAQTLKQSCTNAVLYTSMVMVSLHYDKHIIILSKIVDKYSIAFSFLN